LGAKVSFGLSLGFVGAVRLTSPPLVAPELGVAEPTRLIEEPNLAQEAERSGSSVSTLNPRELESSRLAAAELSNKEIAGQLAYSVNTVKAYLSQLYAKLDVRRRTEVVARAQPGPTCYSQLDAT
jgi:DNA-binding CsgD family transcriptional regulator